jgi:D-alanyl-D-alanine carboxypeptidase (penicillin-binding protein 5/6)
MLPVLGVLCALACLAGPALGAAPRGLSARSAILIEQSTGRVLYGVSPNEQLPIASTTKLMTALLTLEHERLSTVFAQNDYSAAAVDSQIGLVPGERMTVHDLMLALLLPSADDAAEDLAYHVGHGSVAYFVGMMNARAHELGLTHTHYATPSGLDTPGNYSSASDLVKLANFLLEHQPFFAHAVSLRSAVLHSGNHVRHVVNTDTLLGVPWVHGVKTGHTLDAGYVLIGSGHRGGMTLISAVLGTLSAGARDANTLALLDYGFAQFHIVTPVRAWNVLARLTVRYRPGVRAAAIAARTFRRVLPRSVRVSTRVELPRQLTGPIARHAVIGTVLVVAGGRTVARMPLLLAQTLRAVSPLTIAGQFVTRPLTLLLIAAALSVALAIAVRVRHRAHTGRSRGEAA